MVLVIGTADVEQMIIAITIADSEKKNKGCPSGDPLLPSSRQNQNTMDRFKLSQYLHICADEELLPGKSILFATRSGSALEISNLQLQALQQGDWDKISINTLAKLVEVEVLVPEEEDELAGMLEYNIANVKDIDNQKLSFTIQPSANCQLGCHYCGQQHVKKVLDDNTAELILARIRGQVDAHKDHIRELYINWYGGEPLTGLSSLKKLSSRVIALARENKLNYSAFIVTNGLSLKPAIFEELVSQHYIMGYQITVDGTAEYHDKRRYLKSKEQSFDIIFNNICDIVNGPFYKTSGANIVIRCNVDAENKENVLQLLDLLEEKNILPFVSFYVAPIHDWGDNLATQSIHGITKEDFAQFEIEVYMRLLQAGALQNSKKGLLPKRKSLTCMVVSETSEVIDAYGNVSTCWEIPYTPAYEGTDFIAGNLHQDPSVSTANAPMREWFKEIPGNDSWCKTCKFLPVCGGACPKAWYHGSPACPSFKYNINERLFLNKMTIQLNQEIK